MTLKDVVRASLAAPGIRQGLRWFIHQPGVPSSWRDLAHRKLAKRARFPADSFFTYTTHDGAKLRFLHRGTPGYLYWIGEYEPETTSLFCRLAKHARVILDIGAADGIYSVLAASANSTARILAFEPGVAAARTCARNLELNLPTTGRVELHVLALGADDEQAMLYVAGEHGGTSSLNAEFRRDRREQPVTVRRGDRCLPELGVDHVELIKMDTESTEPAVLRGLADTLARDRPDVICEVLAGRTETQLEAIMGSLGYHYYRITRHGLVRHDSLTGDATYREPNYLFTRRTGIELAQLGIAAS